jgi:hypothetical protein
MTAVSSIPLELEGRFRLTDIVTSCAERLAFLTRGISFSHQSVKDDDLRQYLKGHGDDGFTLLRAILPRNKVVVMRWIWEVGSACRTKCTQKLPSSDKLPSQVSHRHNEEGDDLRRETLRYVDRFSIRNSAAISKIADFTYRLERNANGG